MKAASLGSFLAATRHEFLSSVSARRQPIALVIGNESADLDSFTSAVLYAYFRSQAASLEAGGDKGAPPPPPPPPAGQSYYTPFMNIPRADIELRPEHRRVCEHAGVDAAHLCTLDDLGPLDDDDDDDGGLAQALPPGHTRWFLTDHNKLEGKLGEIYGQRVCGVIDHHEDEHAVPEGAEPRIVQPCGSCTSLVVREASKVWEALGQGDAPALSADDSAKLAKFALSSILIDTKNLKNADKTTPTDVDVVEYLRGKIERAAGGGAAYDATAFFEEIKEAKNDIKHMPADGVFRKDYKEWTEAGLRLGTSSAVKRLHKLAKKASKERDGSADAWAQASAAFMAAKRVDLWLVLTSFNDDQGVHRRELALHWARDELQWVADEFERKHGDELQLSRSNVDMLPAHQGSPGRRTWLQSNGAWSRKQIAPALRAVMRDH